MHPKVFIVQFLWLTFDTFSATSVKDAQTKFKLLIGKDGCQTEREIPIQEDLEYPRNDKRILQKVEDMWSRYYDCLMQRAKLVEKPEIRRLLEGQFTELECDICPRPFEGFEAIDWKYKSLSPTEVNMTTLEHLDLLPQMTLTANKTLQIFNVVEDFSGLYVCYEGKEPVSFFILEISKNDTLRRASSIHEMGKKLLPARDMNLIAHYRWSKWTECSSCGRVGKKFRYGTCMVDTMKGQAADARALIYKKNSSAVHGQCTTGQADNSTKHNPERWPITIITRFKYGIPCASQYLPDSLYEQVQNLTAVMAVVKFCLEPCQENEIFQVLDNNGRLIESANNSAGVYSVFQKLPQLPPEVERSSVVAEFGKDIIIQCPGTQLTTTPFTWKIDNKILIPELIAKQSCGRFYIDLLNRIHLKKLRLKDSRIYSCWQKDKLAGTVHLNVEKQLKLGLDHHVTLLGIAVIIGMLLFVGLKIITRELRLRKK